MTGWDRRLGARLELTSSQSKNPNLHGNQDLSNAVENDNADENGSYTDKTDNINGDECNDESTRNDQ